MAQKVTTHLVDDLTGDEIEPGKGATVQFAFDGSSYEIDLTNENADKLRETFSDYIAAARKVSGRGRSSNATASKTRNDPNELAKIRVWAMANGHQVAARGRISQEVRDAYEAAN
ncbi:Lsr2 family protein [Curtobacterium sp. Csp1]|uniref:histone-like nucleoid-structuring protein Lsr2 n=1 Tax=Curtobacterium sp. Csp1 TaxID=2495429 RepID=UPI001599099C|nr:Lsr2 family protein [Curtobacterium sp. Csp1]QKS18879.1 Lsr2 family protein [Curtobacterium sp. Csp1]